jgi:hypothetical protein
MALNASEAAYNAWLASVAAQRTDYATNIAPLMEALRHYVAAFYGGNSATFQSFGFVPHRKPQLTAKTKLQAVLQAAATRKARNTMGRKQRKAIRGVVQRPAIAPTRDATKLPAPTTTSRLLSDGNAGSDHE